MTTADTTSKRRTRGGPLAVLATLCVLIAPATVGHAQPWRGEGGGRFGRGGGGFEPAAYQGRGWGQGGGRRERGYGGPPGPPPGGYEGGAPGGAYGRFGGPVGAGAGWRRGQVLPDDYRGRAVADPGRYHLRAPPAGYGWVGDQRNAYLMQRSTGMVLDAVPGAYEPPPRYAPRGGRGRRR